jgi:hypothetical protein
VSVSSQGIRFHEAVRTLTHVGHIKLFLLEHSSCIGLDSVARFNADLSAYAGGMDEDANVRLQGGAPTTSAATAVSPPKYNNHIGSL